MQFLAILIHIRIQRPIPKALQNVRIGELVP
jgi:hypothetical protein